VNQTTALQIRKTTYKKQAEVDKCLKEAEKHPQLMKRLGNLF
jgi:hypothetical protein